MTQDDYVYDAAGRAVWQDRWYYQQRTGFGIAEHRDDLPQKNKWLAALFGPTTIERYSTPIGWGDTFEIGDTYENFPRMSPWTSKPPQFAFGHQIVRFESVLDFLVLANGVLYNDVLVQSYAQTWDGKTVGARMFMAKGVGPIAINWIGYDKDGKIALTVPRIDAVVTEPPALVS